MLLAKVDDAADDDGGFDDDDNDDDDGGGGDTDTDTDRQTETDRLTYGQSPTRQTDRRVNLQASRLRQK